MSKENGSYTKTSSKPNYIEIVYSDKTGVLDDLVVKYKLQQHCFIDYWIERLISAQKNYHIDDPSRFYGFNDNETEESVNKINHCISVINSYRHVIKKSVSLPIDYDVLNYLHNIFEVYHGLLDQQKHEFFINAPLHVKKALAELNILVHRCESCLRGNNPRHVVTYFGLPKTKTLNPEHYELLTDNYTFGTVYLNYVEIGKTLEDLAIDDDHYIGDNAFRPYKHYSADFVVLFHNSIVENVNSKRQKMFEFYNKNLDFFLARGLEFDNPVLRPGRIPLADLDSHGEDVLQLLKVRQTVKSVQLI